MLRPGGAPPDAGGTHMRQIQIAKPIVAISTLLFAALSTAPVLAQVSTFGAEHQFALSGERLAGVYWVDASSDVDGTVTTPGGATATTHNNFDNTGTRIAFLGNGAGADFSAFPRVDFSTIPRVGFDFFVVQNFSIGGAFIYIHDSDENDTSGTVDPAGPVGNLTQDAVKTETSRDGFVISPRVGYGRSWDHIGIWARGGLTYGHRSDEVDQTTTDAQNGTQTLVNTTIKLSLLTLSLDVQALFIPLDHFGIGVGPFIEIPLTGSIDFEQNDAGTVTNADGDLSALTFGLTATLVGWL